MKKWQKILMIVVIVFAVLGIIKNPLIKIVVTGGASYVMGTKVHIDSFAVGVFKHAVRIKGFKVYNPKGFPKGVLIDINEISVEYDLLSVFKGKLHLPLVVLDLNEMVIVKNKDGKMNIDSLKVSQQKEKPAEKKEEKKKKKKASKQMAIQIDEARLSLGEVIVKDYTKGEPPVILAYDIGVNDKVYKDIKSAEQFATLVMLEAMGPAGLKSAAIYGVATILGVGFLPAGIAGVLIGNDSSTVEYAVSRERAYKEIAGLLKRIGKITKEDRHAYSIRAKVYGSDITVGITEKEKKKSEVKIKARQMMIPKPAVARGITYQLSKILK